MPAPATIILDFTKDELTALLASWGQPRDL